MSGRPAERCLSSPPRKLCRDGRDCRSGVPAVNLAQLLPCRLLLPLSLSVLICEMGTVTPFPPGV